LPDIKETNPYVRGDCGAANSNLPDYINICDINSWSDYIHFDYFFDDCGYFGCEIRNAYIVLNDRVLKTKSITASSGFMELSFLDFKEAIQSEADNGESEFCIKIKYDIVCPGGIVFNSFISDFVAFEKCIQLLNVGDTYERNVFAENISEIVVGNCIENVAIFIIAVQLQV